MKSKFREKLCVLLIEKCPSLVSPRNAIMLLTPYIGLISASLSVLFLPSSFQGGGGVVSAGSFPKTAAGNRALYRFSEAYKIAELLIAKTNHKEKEGICFSWIRKKSDQL